MKITMPPDLKSEFLEGVQQVWRNAHNKMLGDITEIFCEVTKGTDIDMDIFPLVSSVIFSASDDTFETVWNKMLKEGYELNDKDKAYCKEIYQMINENWDKNFFVTDFIKFLETIEVEPNVLQNNNEIPILGKS